ncbi:MAG: redox-sensing transcriptional repressor Rex [Candidatus Latescibacteria bacterium]|nr:redox-sensing transcriptional repressor Rex [Candidatus Latescibacterota bacterium]NIM22669.1 redox-sensing transcriptional repressor Rex [Candidatus Latescibacterota bacterium]NIM64958.1 redox-sensing transcriptional repressor Rex [Candidatus Latescibacterota bacterium]NIO01473.1 redox-sensing transcriptional repressor Rex [Candidatus Latescibacterota bacterium]NIO27983.1 redox-sensing transcriptional repressor Rex [Candidatus Latescibacterota bacterium]
MEKISDFTVRRLSSYYRILSDLEQKKVLTISSAKLAEFGGITSAQVRKDLSYFGNFGTRGLGYNVSELKNEITRILGLNQTWGMALFGAGSLGNALFFHQGFRDDGFFFRYLFDVDLGKIGTKWGNLEILAVDKAKEVLKRDPVDIGVITTPKEAAQDIVDLAVEVGIKGILNFAPRELVVPEGVSLRNVNLAVALESLSFSLSI